MRQPCHLLSPFSPARRLARVPLFPPSLARTVTQRAAAAHSMADVMDDEEFEAAVEAEAELDEEDGDHGGFPGGVGAEYARRTAGTAKEPKKRSPPAIVWTMPRVRALLTMLTCADETPFHGAKATDEGGNLVPTTWGAFRRHPVSGGKAGRLAAVYRHWVAVDPSLAIAADHAMVAKHKKADLAGGVAIQSKLQWLKEVRARALVCLARVCAYCLTHTSHAATSLQTDC